jgi:uncharacterized protein (TIGR03083 family)
MDEQHPEIRESLAAWAADACTAAEAELIASHLRTCSDCAAEAQRMLAVTEQLALATVAAPPPDLREGVLTAAARTRAPSRPTVVSAPLAEAYATQIEQMDRLLAGLTPAHWRAPVAKHGTIGRMVVHLAANDAMLAADIGLPPVTSADAAIGELRRRWRVQAQALVSFTSSDARLLHREVRLAGTHPASGQASAALVQRAFETWTHADDVRMVMGYPTRPPAPHQLRMIADLGVSLLPQALRATGRSHPRRTARLVLTGTTGGEWDIPLHPDTAAETAAHTAAGRTDITVRADIEDFCRLLANRQDPRTFAHEAAGDPAIILDFLYAVTALGCD